LVKVCNNTSATLILNMGTPQGCMLSPFLYSLFTHDYIAKHVSNSIIMFADNTGRPDYQRDSLQGGGESPSIVVPGK
jgi:hypothetical protein